MIQDVLGLPVELAAPFDFSFLARYGTPFCVFDQQQSGNIAFGMQSAQWGKLFVKFAGAPTVNARIDSNGHVVTKGEQVFLGGNDSYLAMCHSCWKKRIAQEAAEGTKQG